MHIWIQNQAWLYLFLHRIFQKYCRSSLFHGGCFLSWLILRYASKFSWPFSSPSNVTIRHGKSASILQIIDVSILICSLVATFYMRSSIVKSLTALPEIHFHCFVLLVSQLQVLFQEFHIIHYYIFHNRFVIIILVSFRPTRLCSKVQSVCFPCLVLLLISASLVFTPMEGR